MYNKMNIIHTLNNQKNRTFSFTRQKTFICDKYSRASLLLLSSFQRLVSQSLFETQQNLVELISSFTCFLYFLSCHPMLLYNQNHNISRAFLLEVQIPQAIAPMFQTHITSLEIPPGTATHSYAIEMHSF